MIYQLAVPGPLADVEEIRVLEWHAGVGDPVAKDMLIVELETHKALVEVRAGQDGILRAILCEPGDWRRIGEALAILSDDVTDAIPVSLQSVELMATRFEVS